MNAAQVTILIIGLVSVLASPTVGQSGATGSGGTQCLAVAVDTTEGYVYGALEPESPDGKVDRERLLEVLGRLSVALVNDTLTLQPVAQLFNIVITAMGQKPDPKPMMMPRWAGHPALATEIAFTLDPSGALTNPRIVGPADSAVAAILLRAVAATPSTRATAADRPQRLRLRLMLASDTSAATTPLVAARQLTVDGTAPRLLPREGAPTWPRAGTRSRQAATVLAWYVVDARGATVAASFGAAPVANPAFAGRYEDFVDAVRTAVRRARHEPATSGGCATARLVVLLVRFDTSVDQFDNAHGMNTPTDRDTHET